MEEGHFTVRTMILNKRERERILNQFSSYIIDPSVVELLVCSTLGLAFAQVVFVRRYELNDGDD
jgi:hypothetical protein